MTKFGEFSLLADLGSSLVADRYKASHATQGAGLFLKVYSRLDPRLHAQLLARCDSLLACTHPNLARHSGHGVVDGLPFVVAPYLEGVDLLELSTSLLDRRVNIGLETVIMVLADLAAAVGALHGKASKNGHALGEAARAPAAPMAHGDVSIGHVRLGPEGQTWLTGSTTPRGDVTEPDARWDIAGVGALIYDLVPLLSGGASRTPLPTPLDRVVRRALGIGSERDHIQPDELNDRLSEVSATLNLKVDRGAFAEIVRRTVRAVEKRAASTIGKKSLAPTGKARTPADAVPSLDPIDRLPLLEPIGVPWAKRPPRRLNIELIAVTDGHGEVEATTVLVARPPPQPSAPPVPQGQPRPVELTPSGPDEGGPPALIIGTLVTAPARAVSIKRPLLADPLENASPLAHVARDTTDPDLRRARTDAARLERAVVALVSRRLVSEAALASALAEHALRGGRVVEILVAAGVLSDSDVADALAAESGCARVSDDSLRIPAPPPALVRRLPQTYVLARRVLPLAIDYGAVTVAVADPFDQATLLELKNLLGAHTVEAVVASRSAITAATREAYRKVGIGGVPGTQGDAHTVLLCTSDDAVASRIGARLAQEGMRVELVVDGDAAKQILSTRPPGVVLCAHDLPHAGAGGKSIEALLLFVRQQPATSETPLFVFGPRGDDALATRILDLGADDYFAEPLKLEVLLAKVRRAFGKGGGVDAKPAPPADLSRAPTTRTPFHAPSLFLDEPTPLTAIGLAPPHHHHPDASAASFINPIAMPGLDDLPDLPADFGDDQREMAPAMPTGVMGTLRQMALTEIVQSLEMGRKNARVELVPAHGDKGMIAFADGQIRYAECGAVRGPEAFYQLAQHTEGFFRIHYGEKPPETNITHQTTYLLLEAMRRMDEAGGAPGS